MVDRAERLVADLGLIPHPEGGYYAELFRSDATVHPTDGRGPRAALTTIYFLLPAGAVSRWHRVQEERLDHQPNNSLVLVGNDDVPADEAGHAGAHCETLDPGDIREWQAGGGTSTTVYALYALSRGVGGSLRH
jgi:hypothetical protein